MGLRPPHLHEVLDTPSDQLPWFEVIAENALRESSPFRRDIETLATKVPLTLHCVSMNLGGWDPLDLSQIRKISKLADAINPQSISDHLCWTSHQGAHHHDLLPLVMTTREAQRIARRIRDVQDVLGRAILIENVSSYLQFSDSKMSEAEFVGLVADLADCHVLLDVNNVVVSCFNHKMTSEAYIKTLPLERIRQFHLAGHQQQQQLRIDDHGSQVTAETCDLWQQLQHRIGPIPTLLEWDRNLPNWATLQAERLRLSRLCTQNTKQFTKNVFTASNASPKAQHAQDNTIENEPISHTYEIFSSLLQSGDWQPDHNSPMFDTNPSRTVAGLTVYRRNTTGNRLDALGAVYQGALHTSPVATQELFNEFVMSQPASTSCLDTYASLFYDWLEQKSAQCEDIQLLDVARCDLYWSELNDRVLPLQESEWSQLKDPDIPDDQLTQIASQMFCIEVSQIAAQRWMHAIWHPTTTPEAVDSNLPEKTYLIMWRDQSERRVAEVELWFYDIINQFRIPK